MTKQAKKQMIIRPLNEMNIDLRTKDLLARALEVYNSGAVKYQRPLTLGLPKNKTLAMDECIKCTDGIIEHFAPEWQALSSPKFLGYALLSSIAQDPLIRAGIETIADDMTRKFIELTSQGDEDLSGKISAIEADLQTFRVKSLFNKALALTGYMGGCLVYIDMGELDDEEKRAPLFLDNATFRKGKFKGFKIIEPINVYPGVYNSSDPTSEDYFNPETWFILGKEYHKSRFLYFAQNEVPLLLKPLYNFFGISLSQQVLEYVQNFTENRRSAQRLLNKFSLTIWKTDMSAFLSGGDCDSLTQRVKYFNAQRNNDGAALIDKELEDMVQINTPLSGVTDIVSMSLDLAPVILGISKDKYFGDLPKGLNASSEGTNRIYYDKIQSLNEKISYNNVAKVLKILQLNRYGEIEDNISFRFAPLWEMDERERAEINKLRADTAAVYVDRGCLSQEEIRGALAGNPDSGYSNIDVDDVPETDNFADVDVEDKDEAGSVFDEALSLDEWDESKHPRDKDGKFEGRNNEEFNPNFSSDLDNLIDKTFNDRGSNNYVTYGKTTSKQEDDAKHEGFDIVGYTHIVDGANLRHILKQHGSERTEKPRGQIPVTKKDFHLIPEILSNYDKMTISLPTEKQPLNHIVYEKKMENGLIFYVEEIRTGRKKLCTKSMYKRKA